MTDKQIEKVVDELIVRLPIGKSFDFPYELSKYFKHIDSDINLNKDKTRIIEKVMNFMIECEYIKDRPNEISDFLETKGIDAKNAGGHFKYLESLKPKKEYWLTKYQIIYLPFFILFGFFGIWSYFSNNDLKVKHQTLNQKHDSLKSDFESLKLKYDSVIKGIKELPKQIPNDSLQTKNSADLNNN